MADQKISALTALTSADSGDTLPIVDVSANLTKKITKEQFVGYKIYRALITQVSGDAPTEIVLENTTGQTATYEYIATGSYRVTFTGTPLTLNKTGVMPAQPIISGNVGGFAAERNSTSQIFLYTANEVGTNTDGVLNNTLLEIFIYP